MPNKSPRADAVYPFYIGRTWKEINPNEMLLVLMFIEIRDTAVLMNKAFFAVSQKRNVKHCLKKAEVNYSH